MDNEGRGEPINKLDAIPQSSKSRLHEKRSASSSSSSSSSRSSSSSSESSRDLKKKKKKSKRRLSKKQRRHDRRLIEKLSNDVGLLQKAVQCYGNLNNNCDNDNESFMSDVSRELYNDCCTSQASLTNKNVDIPDLAFDIETKLKDPSVPKTPDVFLKMLNEVQRFGSNTWSDIRYSDTQKLYNHSPGFVDLETNEEVKAYDNIRHLAYSDKSYAAITFCILKQKEVLLQGLRDIISWSRSPDAALCNLNEKIDETFLKGEFMKVSQDLLQMACGHRAESVEMRRDGILKSVKDPVIKVSLNKIPPSTTHIFEQEAFTSSLEKCGGVRKAFWPTNQDYSSNASRPKPSSGTRHSSRGSGRNHAPPQGQTRCCYNHNSEYSHCNQPSQGNRFSYPSHPRGQIGSPERRNFNPNYRNHSFRSRGSRQGGQPQRGQKRHMSPSGFKGNKKQKQ